MPAEHCGCSGMPHVREQTEPSITHNISPQRSTKLCCRLQMRISTHAALLGSTCAGRGTNNSKQQQTCSAPVVQSHLHNRGAAKRAACVSTESQHQEKEQFNPSPPPQHARRQRSASHAEDPGTAGSCILACIRALWGCAAASPPSAPRCTCISRSLNASSQMAVAVVMPTASNHDPCFLGPRQCLAPHAAMSHRRFELFGPQPEAPRHPKPAYPGYQASCKLTSCQAAAEDRQQQR